MTEHLRRIKAEREGDQMITNNDLSVLPTIAQIEDSVAHDRTVTRTRLLRAIEDLETTVGRLREDAVSAVDRDLTRESLAEVRGLVYDLERFVFDYHAILFEDGPEPDQEER